MARAWRVPYSLGLKDDIRNTEENTVAVWHISLQIFGCTETNNGFGCYHCYLRNYLKKKKINRNLYASISQRNNFIRASIYNNSLRINIWVLKNFIFSQLEWTIFQRYEVYVWCEKHHSQLIGQQTTQLFIQKFTHSCKMARFAHLLWILLFLSSLRVNFALSESWNDETVTIRMTLK